MIIFSDEVVCAVTYIPGYPALVTLHCHYVLGQGASIQEVKVNYSVCVSDPPLLCVFMQGKTVYYNHELSHSHMRVSTAEIYRSDPNANLRIIIQKIVAELRKVREPAPTGDINLLARPDSLAYHCIMVSLCVICPPYMCI